MKIKGTTALFLYACMRVREGATERDRSPEAYLHVYRWGVCFQHITNLLAVSIFSFWNIFFSFNKGNNCTVASFPLLFKYKDILLEVWHERHQPILFSFEHSHYWANSHGGCVIWFSFGCFIGNVSSKQHFSKFWAVRRVYACGASDGERGLLISSLTQTLPTQTVIFLPHFPHPSNHS